MNESVTQSEIEAALQRLIDQVRAPRALVLRAEERAAVLRAAERAAAQLLGEADAVLTIALAGCSGAGKSTLINALAGSTIAEASERRPCTMQIKVYHHHEVAKGGLPQDLATQAVFVAHDRPELRHKVIVDTPDLDTFATQNRAATKALLKAAGLVVYVFSPERYLEERAWSVIREERRFSACFALLNKADMVPPYAVEQIAAEICQRFADMGEPHVKILRVCAANHVPRPDDRSLMLNPIVVDEFSSLRAYIEDKLNTGDIARMRHEQHVRVIDNLCAEVERLAPQAAIDGLKELAVVATEHAHTVGERLAEELAGRLAAVEAELAPIAAMRKHQRFWGPFRTWLAATDFARFGLPQLVRRLRYVVGGGTQGGIPATILAVGATHAAEDLVRGAAQELQDLCFARHLPVDRWGAIAAEANAAALLTQAAAEIEARYEASASAMFGKSKPLIWGVSLLGSGIPAFLVAFGLIQLLRSVFGGPYTGFDILGQTLALWFFSYVVLHGLVALILAGGEAFTMRGIGAQTIHDLVKRMLEGWVAAYRAEVEADLSNLREPLETLQAVIRGTPVNRLRSAVSQTMPAVDTPPTEVQALISSTRRPAHFDQTTSAAALRSTDATETAESAVSVNPLSGNGSTGTNAAEHLRRAMQRYTAKIKSG
jgi:hypothetical protein